MIIHQIRGTDKKLWKYLPLKVKPIAYLQFLIGYL